MTYNFQEQNRGEKRKSTINLLKTLTGDAANNFKVSLIKFLFLQLEKCILKVKLFKHYTVYMKNKFSYHNFLNIFLVTTVKKPATINLILKQILLTISIEIIMFS